MRVKIQSGMKLLPSSLMRYYPSLFALLFWSISIAPVLNPNLSLNLAGTNFNGHAQLIQIINNFRLRLGDRVFSNVLAGGAGWLYYTPVGELSDYQRSDPFSKNELANFQKRLDEIDTVLERKGITFLVVIPPDKATIYPQFIPMEIRISGEKSRLDQFTSYMKQHGKTPILDLRPDLIAASKTEQVYYKTDPHWNATGWYIAYSRILSALSGRYRAMKPRPYSDYQLSAPILATLELPQVMGVPNIQEGVASLQPRFSTGVSSAEIPLTEYAGSRIRFSINQDQNLPNALVYHDSFFLMVIPLLEPHFRQTTSVFRDSNPRLWSISWVDQVHPDVVILEFAEFYMNRDFMSKNFPSNP